jgi:hypothetical protein
MDRRLFLLTTGAAAVGTASLLKKTDNTNVDESAAPHEVPAQSTSSAPHAKRAQAVVAGSAVDGEFQLAFVSQGYSRASLGRADAALPIRAAFYGLGNRANTGALPLASRVQIDVAQSTNAGDNVRFNLWSRSVSSTLTSKTVRQSASSQFTFTRTNLIGLFATYDLGDGVRKGHQLIQVGRDVPWEYGSYALVPRNAQGQFPDWSGVVYSGDPANPLTYAGDNLVSGVSFDYLAFEVLRDSVRA